MKSSLIYILLFIFLGNTVIATEIHPNQESKRYMFIENKNQWPLSVKFMTPIPSGRLFIGNNSLTYNFYDPLAFSKCHACSGHHHTSRHNKNHLSASPKMVDMHAFKVEFVNGNQSSNWTPYAANPGKYNYFIGNDPSRWASAARSFSYLSKPNIYDNIHLQLYESHGRLKYDFRVNPMGNPNDIKMRYTGADGISIEDGNLMIQTSLGKMQEKAPIAYQMIGKDSIAVQCAYSLNQDEVTFSFPEGYDKKYPLIIDPLLIFSTFSGSSADNWGNTATYDDEGNLYSGGIANNTGFPATLGAYQTFFSGAWDIAILKYDSLGENLHYATYIGGALVETPQSLLVNHQGDLIILGTTSSYNFPTINAYQDTLAGGTATEILSGIFYDQGSDLFIAKLSEDGSELLSSTYLGGTQNDGVNYYTNPLVKNYGDQYRGDVIVDENDNVYIATNTTSNDFPVLNSFQDTFNGGTHDGIVAKFTPDLSNLLWSSYLGGNRTDAVYSIKLQGDSLVYVGGGTDSDNFVSTAGAYQATKPGNIDGFITVIRQNPMQVAYSTFIGTSSYDQNYLIDIDLQGYVYAVGQTDGNFPIKAAAGKTLYQVEDGGQYIVKLTSELKEDSNCFSTVFGSGSGSPDISLTAFLVNECGNLYITGWGGQINTPQYWAIRGRNRNFIGGSTANLPVTDNAFQSETEGNDFYMMVLQADAQSMLYATFFGGKTSVGEHVDGGTSRFDKRGIVYQAVCADCGNNTDSDFPTTPGVWSRENNSPNCNNAAFKFDLASLKAAFVTNSPEGDQPGLSEGCFPLEVMFENTSIGGKTYFWDFDNGDTQSTLTRENVFTTYEKPGIYNVRLVVLDENTCQQIDVAQGFITVFNQNFTVSPSDSICFGEQIQLSASGGVAYQWTPAGSINNPTAANPIASPDTTTHYIVSITDQNDCEFADTVTIAVSPEIEAAFDIDKIISCDDFPVFSFTNLSKNATSYVWNFGDGTILNDENPSYRFSENGQFEVTLTAQLNNCSQRKSEVINNVKPFVPNIFTPNNDSFNQNFVVTATEQVSLEVFNRWGKKVYQDEAYQNDWKASGLANGIYYYRITFPNQEVCNGWLQILR